MRAGGRARGGDAGRFSEAGKEWLELLTTNN